MNPSARTDGQETPLPLKRIVILASGLAYYEHSGTLNAPAQFSLPFKIDAINDALKSLVINDPASAHPSVVYPSEQTLRQTLRSLKIDLSESPDTAQILSGLRGAELEIAAPNPVSGRIVGVETRSGITSGGKTHPEAWLSLYTPEGLRLFRVSEIASFAFKDPAIAHDLVRALDLIADVQNETSRDLQINLEGSATRQVSLSYVIPAPVWKVSYRLDLGSMTDSATALFQGWAIVDNDTDADWNQVELSLVAGRPVSFIQSLYPPYYVARPTLPLAIAGTAAAQTHDSAYTLAEMAEDDEYDDEMSEVAESRCYAPMMEASAAGVAGGAVQTARGAEAGDQFGFTIQHPVSLNRRMSAMLPLTESRLEARKLLIFSGTAGAGRTLHPRLGAELSNTSGMKLPAGPITVYDGGVYAGDALIEFWNEEEKRLISFGEDLSVTGFIRETDSHTLSAVTISGGVMTFARKQTFCSTYQFRNSGTKAKDLRVEHPITSGTSLVSPAADEQTATAYRFSMKLSAGKEHVLTIREERPLEERIALFSLHTDALASYTSQQEIPANVRSALQQAITLKEAVSTLKATAAELDERRKSLVADQQRLRENFQAVGGQTQPGQDYLKRMTALDNELDALILQQENARAQVKSAQRAYESYLKTLKL